MTPALDSSHITYDSLPCTTKLYLQMLSFILLLPIPLQCSLWIVGYMLRFLAIRSLLVDINPIFSLKVLYPTHFIYSIDIWVWFRSAFHPSAKAAAVAITTAEWAAGWRSWKISPPNMPSSSSAHPHFPTITSTINFFWFLRCCILLFFAHLQLSCLNNDCLHHSYA